MSAAFESDEDEADGDASSKPAKKKKPTNLFTNAVIHIK
jgi:hypothetical protein